jgi:hypothetical protein
MDLIENLRFSDLPERCGTKLKEAFNTCRARFLKSILFRPPCAGVFMIAAPSERQRIGNQINATMSFARTIFTRNAFSNGVLS